MFYIKQFFFYSFFPFLLNVFILDIFIHLLSNMFTELCSVHSEMFDEISVMRTKKDTYWCYSLCQVYDTLACCLGRSSLEFHNENTHSFRSLLWLWFTRCWCSSLKWVRRSAAGSAPPVADLWALQNYAVRNINIHQTRPPDPRHQPHALIGCCCRIIMRRAEVSGTEPWDINKS